MKITITLLSVSLLAIYIILPGCCTSKKNEQTVVSTNFPGPPAIVYKTRNDYSKNVPVILSAAKDSIVSYPAVEDVMLNGQYPLPALLKNGYYLDNRGIGPDVAFTKYTYEQYSKFRGTPTVEDLMNAIIDKDPLTEMYNCGNRLRFSNAESELNELIVNGELEKKCTRIK